MVDPIAFTLGPFTVRWYGVLMAAGFLLGYFITQKIAKEKKIDAEKFGDLYLYLIISIILGARLFHVFVYEPGYYLSDPIRILYIWQGGLASHGAILGSLLVAYFIGQKKYKIHILDTMDIITIVTMLGAAFVRIGNFINQEIVGRVTDVSWGMVFERYDNQIRHPSQLYESAANFILFAFVYSIRNLKKWPRGFIFFFTLSLYSLVRFFIEFFKEYDGISSSSPLTMGGYLSIIFFAIGLIGIWAVYRKK